MPGKHSAVFLGSLLTDSFDSKVEVLNRLGDCIATANRQKLFRQKARSEHQLDGRFKLSMCCEVQAFARAGMHTAQTIRNFTIERIPKQISKTNPGKASNIHRPSNYQCEHVP